MKKHLKSALKSFYKQNMCVSRKSKKKEIKNEIIAIADNDEGFENMVFEIGCDVLARRYMEQ